MPSEPNKDRLDRHIGLKMQANHKGHFQLPFHARRVIEGLKEPMRTRVAFYLEEQMKDGSELTFEDVKVAVSAAVEQRMLDESEEPDLALCSSAIADLESGNVVSLEDLFDAA